MVVWALNSALRTGKKLSPESFYFKKLTSHHRTAFFLSNKLKIIEKLGVVSGEVWVRYDVNRRISALAKLRADFEAKGGYLTHTSPLTTGEWALTPPHQVTSSSRLS